MHLRAGHKPAQSHTTVVIPFHEPVVFIRSLNRAEFSGRLCKISQTLDAIRQLQKAIEQSSGGTSIFKGVGSGVLEIALRYASDAYRVVRAIQIGSRIYAACLSEEIEERH